MSLLSSNLKRLMGQQKITVSELARRTEIAQPIIHRLSTGKNTNPKIATISPIARYFTVTISHLIGELPLSVGEQADSVSSNQRAWRRVPALSWHDAVVQRVDAFYNPSSDMTYVSTDADVGEHAYALTVESRSMEPVLPFGTALIVDPDRSVSDGDCVVVRLGDSQTACLRRVVCDGADRYFKSINPEFDENRVTRQGPSDRILAVVVQAKLNF